MGLYDGRGLWNIEAMKPAVQGVCSQCGGAFEFALESMGLVQPCPRCGQATRLVPADPQALEQLPVVPANAESDAEEDGALRRQWLKLTIVTVILVAVLVGLVVAAKKLPSLKPKSDRHQMTNQVRPAVEK
jgi:predicted  nucleic acid-binding Zn-ribbon protein